MTIYTIETNNPFAALPTHVSCEAGERFANPCSIESAKSSKIFEETVERQAPLRSTLYDVLKGVTMQEAVLTSALLPSLYFMGIASPESGLLAGLAGASLMGRMRSMEMGGLEQYFGKAAQLCHNQTVRCIKLLSGKAVIGIVEAVAEGVFDSPDTSFLDKALQNERTLELWDKIDES